MALDVGNKKIGVAITDPLQLYARPLTTLFRGNLHNDQKNILKLIQKYKISSVVLGLPLHVSGDESPSIDYVKPLAKTLTKKNIKIEWQDERFSSHFAEEHMSSLKIPVTERRRLRDQYAAALILTWYLEAHN